MDFDGLVMGDGFGRRAEDLDARGHHRDRGERARPDDDHSAPKLVLLDTGEVQRDSATRARHVERAFVGLDPADSRALAGRQDLDLVSGRERTVDERSSHNGAEAGEREGPVDPQARPAEITTRRGGGQNSVERVDELDQARLGGRRHFDHRRGCERCSLQRRGHIAARERCPLVVDEIALRERDDTAVDAKHAKNREVLARLGHHAFVERDHK